MTVRVRLFAGLREAAGHSDLKIELDDDRTVAGLLNVLRGQLAIGDLLERLPVIVAINSFYVDDSRVIEDGDEVALIPPISGGSKIRATIRSGPLDVSSITAEAGDPAAGAVVVFQGVTREVAKLDYEAYQKMAEQRMGEILLGCTERFQLCGAVAEHRIGEVPLGEPSVIVAVSAPHREEAFAGARAAIDQIKAEAPIWKVEITVDNVSRRVEGQLPAVDQEAKTNV